VPLLVENYDDESQVQDSQTAQLNKSTEKQYRSDRAFSVRLGQGQLQPECDVPTFLPKEYTIPFLGQIPVPNMRNLLHHIQILRSQLRVLTLGLFRPSSDANHKY